MGQLWPPGVSNQAHGIVSWLLYLTFPWLYSSSKMSETENGGTRSDTELVPGKTVHEMNMGSLIIKIEEGGLTLLVVT